MREWVRYILTKNDPYAAPAVTKITVRPLGLPKVVIVRKGKP